MAINISGILKTPQGSAIQNAEIIFEQTRTSTEVLAGTKFSIITNQTGNYSSSLGVGIYVFKVRFQEETQYRTVASNVIVTQSMNNYTLNQIIQDQSQLQDVDYDLLQQVLQARDQAAVSAQSAQTSQTTANTKATEAANSAQAALQSKNAAQTSEANALASKNAAQTSQTNAANSQTAAATSQTTATTKATEASSSAQAALQSKNAAQTSEANALASKNAAQTSQTTASTKASEAAASQTTATTKASEAASSQVQAQQSQSDAGAAASQADTSEQQAQQSQTLASTSQGTATTKASEASSSAQAALASKNAAQTSESNALASKNQAQASQSNAASSQTAAAGSQATATTKATEASTSQTNAANSQTTATTKAGEASTSQTNAAASQAIASTKAGEASSSQTDAAGSQSTATTEAAEATNSAILAQKWAANPENSVVSGGLYSALHYAAKASQAAQTAVGQLIWRGGWSAQEGNAPPTPTTTTQDFYRITQAGTILSVQYEVGDYIHWDNLNSIWFKMDGTDSVISVNGRTGAVIITKTDVELSLVNNWGASSQTNDASTTTYATTAGVKAAYDLAATKLTATANAVSATKLVTTRTINGTNFDGTANITTQTWGTSRNLTIGGTAKAVNGSADVSWTLDEIGAAPKTHDHSGYVRDTLMVNNKPLNADITLTAADVGALPITGGTLTGPLTVKGSTYHALTLDSTDVAGCVVRGRKDGVDDWYVGRANAAGDVALYTYKHSTALILRVDGVHLNKGLYVDTHKVYHEGFKPTAADVGATVSSTLSGNIDCDTISTSGTYNVNTNGAVNWPFGATGGTMIVTVHSENTYITQMAFHGANNAMSIRTKAGSVWTAWKKVYNEDFKPTAYEIGAAPSGFGLGSDSFTSRGSINRLMGNGWQEYNAEGGDTDGPYEYGNVLHIGQKSNATTYARWASQLFMSTNGSVFTRVNTTKGSFAGSKWNKVYTEQDKPSAADIGAVDKAGDALTGSLSFSATAGSAPLVLNRGAQVGVQFNVAPAVSRFLGVDVSGTMRFGINADYSQNWKVYHEGFKPTAADVGALSLSGGVISNRVSVYGTTKPMVEYHVPSIVAFATYAESTDSTFRIGQSNGSGVVSKTLMSINGSGTLAVIGELWAGSGTGRLGATGLVSGSVWGGSVDIATWCRANFAPISDRNLKNNIHPSNKSALEDISKIDFVSYDWDSTNPVTRGMMSPKIGVIAQQLEEVDPCYSKDVNTFKEDGSVETSTKVLNVTNLLALALKAIQELQQQLQLQQKQINELKVAIDQ